MPSCLGDALDDLTAQRPLGLVSIELAGEEPRVVTAAQAWPEHREVEPEHLTHHLGEGIFQRLIVFDVLGRNDEVVGRLRSTNPYDILLEMERCQVRKPHRRDQFDLNGQGDLGRHRGLDERVTLRQGLVEELTRQRLEARAVLRIFERSDHGHVLFRQAVTALPAQLETKPLQLSELLLRRPSHRVLAMA